MKPENEPYIYSLQLCELFIYGKMRLSFIDSDVLYRGVLSDRLDYAWRVSQYHEIQMMAFSTYMISIKGFL